MYSTNMAVWSGLMCATNLHFLFKTQLPCLLAVVPANRRQHAGNHKKSANLHITLPLELPPLGWAGPLPLTAQAHALAWQHKPPATAAIPQHLGCTYPHRASKVPVAVGLHNHTMVDGQKFANPVVHIPQIITHTSTKPANS